MFACFGRRIRPAAHPGTAPPPPLLAYGWHGVRQAKGLFGAMCLTGMPLRFHDLERGRLRIDGRDIRELSQESLRAAIGMVTQDTSLLHRSIAANIGYGRHEATHAELLARGPAGGPYARLWAHHSGGYLVEEAA